EVCFHSPARDVEPVADLRIGQSLGDQLGDTALGRGEAVPARPRPAAGSPAATVGARLAARPLHPGATALGRGGAVPARPRPAAGSPAATVDARLAERRLGAGEVAGGAQLL